VATDLIFGTALAAILNPRIEIEGIGLTASRVAAESEWLGGSAIFNPQSDGVGGGIFNL